MLSGTAFEILYARHFKYLNINLINRYIFKPSIYPAAVISISVCIYRQESAENLAYKKHAKYYRP